MPEPIYRHQITKLSPGKHHSPQHGVCVMELASKRWRSPVAPMRREN